MAAAIARAGFHDGLLTRQRLRDSVFYPVNTTIRGIAVRDYARGTLAPCVGERYASAAKRR